ncbi:hypothetical protein SeKA_A3344 [Salmonella enterica subsp. enterica serovar Kentucky str. CVM29188]|nr:hypothetical protein SeKA_A3344 [Salmonella enterica subsp. enterica serovar Kentucky str. CVM29188]EDZ20041.1 hypothetical protein SeKB_A3913 [Salmonella enterica subsp. enterica serovar Kentucky str. CDC 191]
MEYIATPAGIINAMIKAKSNVQSSSKKIIMLNYVFLV